MYPSIITDSSITVLFEDGIPQVINDRHPNFDRVRDAVRDQEWESVRYLMDLSSAVTSYVQGKLVVSNGCVYYEDIPLHNAVVDRLLDLMEEGFSVDYLLNFLENVCENPDPRAVDGLYSWLERGNLPITEDGYIIAYKIVNSNYRDIYTGKFDNSVGSICEIPRFACDSDPDRTCSAGLHFCSAEYLPHYGVGGGSRVMLVKVNPRDVVAFPNDYNISKGRCCRYEVIQEIDARTAASFFQNNSTLWFSA